MIEAGPDYVGLTEIAELLGISRQAMRKILTKNIETFPLPVHEGNPSIWHLKDVLGWMREEQGRAFDSAIEEVSAVGCVEGELGSAGSGGLKGRSPGENSAGKLNRSLLRGWR